MAQQQLTLSVSIAWWLGPYLRMLAVICWLTGKMPDQDRLMSKVRRATRVSVAPCR